MSSVDVSGFSSATTEAELHDFFSFCGKIKSIDFKDGDGTAKKAVISFEKPSAAHTALMLNGGNLGSNTLTVTSETVPPPHHKPEADEHQPHIEQADKPRAGIAAEYLAHGHMLTDDILRRAIDIDNKHGISKKFLSFMSDLDKSVGQKALGPDQTVSAKIHTTIKEAHTRAKSIDEQKGYSKVAREYYEKALASPIGRSIMSFYTSTSKQVRDIHDEALRIKAAKTAHASTPSTGPAATSTSTAPTPAPAPVEPRSSK